MTALDVIAFVLNIMNAALDMLSVPISGFAFWQIILVSGLPVGLLTSRFLWIRHRAPYEAHQKHILFWGTLVGWFNLTWFLYVVIVQIVFGVIRWFTNHQPLKFLLLLVKNVMRSLKNAAVYAKNKVSGAVEKLVEKAVVF